MRSCDGTPNRGEVRAMRRVPHRDRVLSPEERQKEVIVCVAECAGPRLILDI